MSRLINVIVSVDWEGRQLADEDLATIGEFRQRFPQVPMQHFLNAAYFTKDGCDTDDVRQRMHSILRPDDEHGLHIHGWRSLFSRAGVTPRQQPTLFNPETPLRQSDGDWGHEVCIDTYSVDELRQVIDYSCQVLQQHGIRRPRSFRAGAWLAADNVLLALAKEGFIRDCSAAWIAPLKPRWGSYHLYHRCAQLWSHINQTSQPHVLPLAEGLTIEQYPNNGCLADYVNADVMVETFERNLATLKPESAAAVPMVSIGFHVESAAKYLPRIATAIERYTDIARKNNVDLSFAVPGPKATL